MNVSLAPLIAVLGAESVRTEADALAQAVPGWSPLAAKARQDKLTANVNSPEGVVSGVPLPLGVLFPGSVEEVVHIVTFAAKNNLALRPIGGLTGQVTSTPKYPIPNTQYPRHPLFVGTRLRDGAVQYPIPNTRDDPKAEAGYLAVDLARLDTVSWDEESLLVTVGTGKKWGELETLLNRHEYTLGHFPTTMNAMTVGGAVATNSIGLFSGKYGRASDLVQGVEGVLASGDVLRLSAIPGANAYFNLLPLFIGTEGAFGIVTEVTLAMRPVPEVRAFAVFAFDRFSDAVDAARLVARSDAQPTALRVLDHIAATPFAEANFLLILAFEGDELTQTGQYQLAYAVCQQTGGQPLTAELGDTWFERRFDTDFLAANARPDALADVLAVGAKWSDMKAVEMAIRNALTPQVTRLSLQLCHPTAHGAALEVRFEMEGNRPELVQRYGEALETAYTASREAGGFVAHHYGLGESRLPYFREQIGATATNVICRLQFALDTGSVLTRL